MGPTREQEIFESSLSLPSPAERLDFVTRACAGDSALRGRVEALLSAYALQDGGASQAPTGSVPLSSARAPAGEGVGTMVGRYRLLELLGEGGFGSVWAAEQREPVRRRVALKIIKLGMDTKQVIARFEAERQALAMMDHPHIAKVFDGGVTDAGRPFFAMELVKGVPITQYCEDAKASARERLELFTRVCAAIQHAHQKGIIHRDVKPSNILVTLHDGVPVPKVIDFGIAKATQGTLTEKTIYTQIHQFIGTPVYMSPEQAALSGLDIDTRSDIYSLGVLLYELLTGTTPLDSTELLRVGMDEMRRLIRETEPLRPSTRLSQTLAAESPARPAGSKQSPAQGARAFSTRAHEARETIAMLRGDLDWIVMKCLEKDRTRRYESASALADDLQRHLRNEPVVARPPSRTYIFRKLARRHRAGLITAAIAAAAILVTIAGLAVSTVRIAREQETTKQALRSETQAKTELQQAIRRELVDAYFHRITLAHREVSDDDIGRAQQLLGECPEDLRHWEWSYLKRLCRVDPTALRDNTEVHAVAFHPAADQVAAACADATVRIKDARTGKLLQTLRGHESMCYSVAFRPPDGRQLASAGTDRTIRVWDVAAGLELFRRGGHVGDYTGMSQAVAFSPDGRQLVAGNEAGIVTVWNADDGQEIRQLPEKHENTASNLAYSPDGRWLASGSWGGVLRIWDAQTFQLWRTAREHSHRIGGLVFSPDSRRVATASFDREVKVQDVATGEVLRSWRAHPGVISGLVYSRDGLRLFSIGGEDKAVKAWDPMTGREILRLRAHAEFGQCLAASPDGLRLASAGGDGMIKMWDASPLRGDEGLEALTCEHDSEVWSVAYSPDGHTLASATWTGHAQLRDAATGALLRSLSQAQDALNIFHLAFSPDGKSIAGAGQTLDRTALVTVWETATGRKAGDEIRERGVPFVVTYDPSGQYLVREGPGHSVQVRSSRDGRVEGLVGRHQRQIWCMAFSPDGKRLATASNDDTVQVWPWDAEHPGRAREPELVLTAPVRGWGSRVAFSADGAWLATGGLEHTVKIWNVQTGKEAETLRGHSGDVWSVAFSRDGRWLASAGEDTTIRIWDARSWKPLHKLRGHEGFVVSLAFSPDSLALASGSRDRTLKVWAASRWTE
jgi:WD40 repeat protein/serine/threonine protein kinase